MADITDYTVKPLTDFVDWGVDVVTTWFNDLFGLGSTNSGRNYQEKMLEKQMDFARESQGRQAQINQDLQDRQNAFVSSMWQQNNAYNSPLAQAHRLSQAGINPNALVSSNNPVVASSTPSAPSAPSVGLPSSPNGLSNPYVSQLNGGTRDFLRLLNETKKTDADVDVLTKQLEGLEIDNLTKQEYLDIVQKTGLEKANKEVALLIAKAAEADATAKKLLSDKDLNGYKEKTEEAQRALLQAKEKLDSKQAELLDIEIDNRQALIDSTIEKNRADASSSRANARLTNEEAYQLEEMRNDNLAIRNIARGQARLDYDKAFITFNDQIDILENESLITKAQAEEAREHLRVLKRNNQDWLYYSDWFLGNLERINNGVNKWAPWALSRTDSERTVTTDFNEFGEATGSHSRIYTHDSSYKPRWK